MLTKSWSLSWRKQGQDPSTQATKMTGGSILTEVTVEDQPLTGKGYTSRLVRTIV